MSHGEQRKVSEDHYLILWYFSAFLYGSESGGHIFLGSSSLPSYSHPFLFLHVILVLSIFSQFHLTSGFIAYIIYQMIDVKRPKMNTVVSSHLLFMTLITTWFKKTLCFICFIRLSYVFFIVNCDLICSCSFEQLQGLEGTWRKEVAKDRRAGLFAKTTSKSKHLTILAHWWTMPPGNTVWNTRIHHTW